MAADDDEDDELEDGAPDRADLENTLRHGLQELANDAPRGEKLWDTTTSMIAINLEDEDDDIPLPPAVLPSTVASPSVPPPSTASPLPPPPGQSEMSSRAMLVIGILIGVVIALIVVIVLLILRHDSSPSTSPPAAGASETKPSSGATTTTLPKPGPPTSAVFPAGAIPARDFVFDDDATSRIVVADAAFNELGLIDPGQGARWRALMLSRDRGTLFLTQIKPTTPCNDLWAFDLRTRVLRDAATNATAVAISPDATKAIVRWTGSCASAIGQLDGRFALRNLLTGEDVVLAEVTGAPSAYAAWSPDSSRFAIELVGTHRVDVYDALGTHLAVNTNRPASSQDALGWTSDGLVLVDLGNDSSAILRPYGAVSSAPGDAIGRVRPVPAGGDHGPLKTPVVRSIVQVGGVTYVEISGSSDGLSYAQLRKLQPGSVPVVLDRWFSRRLVG